MQSTLFPHDTVRDQQDQLISGVLTAIDNKGALVVHAPTGLGKTAAALAPAIERAITENKVVIFMTSRLTQHALALETVSRIRQKHNVHINVVDLIGKKHMCLQPGVDRLGGKEFAEYCKSMRTDELCEYYNRLKTGEQLSSATKSALVQLGNQSPNSPAQVKMVSGEEEHHVCPYEITMLMAKDARVIITDYSYIFNDTIRDGFFKRINKELADCILIIDEGHNLPERIKELATERITTNTIKRAMNELQKAGHEDHKHHVQQIGELLTRFAGSLRSRDYGRENGRDGANGNSGGSNGGQSFGSSDERHITRDEFLNGLTHICPIELLISDLESVATRVREEQKSSSCGALADFLTAWAGPDEGYTRILRFRNERAGTLERSAESDSDESGNSVREKKDDDFETVHDENETDNQNSKDNKLNAFFGSASTRNTASTMTMRQHVGEQTRGGSTQGPTSSIQGSTQYSLFGNNADTHRTADARVMPSSTMSSNVSSANNTNNWNNTKQLEIIYRCLDPSTITKPVFDDAYSTVIMSGTLTPTSMYAQILGLDTATQLTLNSPFPLENRLNIIIPKTTTKYTMRSVKMYQETASICRQITEAVPGNSAIFFPSYNILAEVKSTLEHTSSRTIFTEHPSFSKEEREDLLSRFKQYKHVGAVLLGVMGGSFSEGIDLPGDELRAVVIVGLPLSRPDLETKALIEHYDKKFGKGWDYGYTYPAFNKTLQSAGRCIRTETDRGAIIFLDERYAWQSYYACFPREWSIKITLKYEEIIKYFFDMKNLKKS